MTNTVHYTSAPGVDTVLSTVRIGALTLVTSAKQGTVGTCTIEVPDTAGAITTHGLKRLYDVEDACVGATMLWNGYLADRVIGRGAEGHKGTERSHTVNLVDLNTLLDNYLIDPDKTGAGKRPAETDGERVSWLLGSGFLPQVHDHGCVNAYSGTQMDACDYTGQTAGDVLRDCGEHSGFNWFVYYDETWTTDTHRDALFYDKSEQSELFSSALRLSNVPGDADGATTWDVCSDPAPEMTQDPSRVVDAILMEFTGGSVFRKASDIGLTTTTDFYVRQKVAQSANTKSATAASTMADRQLIDNSKENITAKCAVLLPAAKAGLIKAGHRIECRFSHFDPPYNDWAWWRITQLTVRDDMPETTGADKRYRLELELSPQDLVRGVHQVVLAAGKTVGSPSAIGPMTAGGAPVLCYFAGADTAVTLGMSGIACDTDAYATPSAIADAQTSTAGPLPGYGAQRIVIPAGLGGTYRASWEEFVEGLQWINVGPWYGPDIHGTGVAYEPCGDTTGIAYGLYSADSTATISLCVNGVPVHSETGHPNGFDTRAVFLFRARDGDVITLQASWAGTVTYMGPPFNALGVGPYSTQQGLLALVRLGD